jgi:uncharacterized protein YhbP (UPF0306 family)
MKPDELGEGMRLRLDEQSFAVLSTLDAVGLPHSTIVCFCAADHLATLAFVTPRTTRKFENLRLHPDAALFIDDRSNSMADIKNIWGIEARGRVRVASDLETPAYRDLFLTKYPTMEDFILADSSAICLLEVEKYDIVNRFQDVTHYVPDSSS